MYILRVLMRDTVRILTRMRILRAGNENSPADEKINIL